MSTDVFIKAISKRNFKPGEREHISANIRMGQATIRYLHKIISKGETDVSLAYSSITHIRKIISEKRKILGLKPWK